MVKTQTKIPLTRPIFTEEAQKTTQNKAPPPHGNEKMATDLLRLEKLPRVTGNVTVQMMEEFKCFPWTQTHNAYGGPVGCGTEGVLRRTPGHR